MTRALALLGRLRRCRSGVAMTEFALAMPFVLTAALWGAETAHLALVNMRVSQLALHLADNASRIGDTSTLEDRRIYESDVNDLLLGSNLQAGAALDFYKHGRAIVSSLEVDEDSGAQYIHWQRCKGRKPSTSNHGDEGEEVAGGMGRAGEEVTAQPGEAVIFVEVAYDYQPLVSGYFVNATTINATAAFTVRDSRDLSQIYQREPASPDPIARCNRFDDYSATAV